MRKGTTLSTPSTADTTGTRTSNRRSERVAEGSSADTIAAELDELQRRYRIMEGDRKSYAEEVQAAAPVLGWYVVAGHLVHAMLPLPAE